MREKTGYIEKIVYNFDTSKNLEIFLPTLNRWHRVTPSEFRSFNGKRRIQGQEYEGPVYIYNTNKKTRSNKELNIIVGHKWVSVRRPGEDWGYE